MEYILLKSGSGIIVSEKRRLKTKEVSLRFLNAPTSVTATLKTNKGCFYKKISDDTHSCKLDLKGISGSIEINLSSVFEGKPSRWKCESLFVSNEDGETVVYAVENPNKTIAKLFEEYELMDSAINSLAKRFTELEKKIADSFSDDII